MMLKHFMFMGFVVCNVIISASGQMCIMAPTYCGPYIELDRCERCCNAQFPKNQEACVQWCFEGVLRKGL